MLSAHGCRRCAAQPLSCPRKRASKAVTLDSGFRGSDISRRQGSRFYASAIQYQYNATSSVPGCKPW